MTCIVWAEDSDTDRALIEAALPSGIEVRFAEDGREALGLAETHRPALLVLDVQMPPVGGIEALRLLRTDANLASQRVVMFSSSARPDEIAAARDLGALAYVQKPISFAAFTGAVAAIVAHAQPLARPAAAAHHHVVLWDSDADLADMAERFLREGHNTGHGLIVLATARHLEALQSRLDAPDAQWLDAEQTLAAITRDGVVRPDVFAHAFDAAFAAASRNGTRPVTCFGELVALLQARGQHATALTIEEIGQSAARQHAGKLRILCAYPLADLQAGQAEAICARHTARVATPEAARRNVAA